MYWYVLYYYFYHSIVILLILLFHSSIIITNISVLFYKPFSSRYFKLSIKYTDWTFKVLKELEFPEADKNIETSTVGSSQLPKLSFVCNAIRTRKFPGKDHPSMEVSNTCNLLNYPQTGETYAYQYILRVAWADTAVGG